MKSINVMCICVSCLRVLTSLTIISEIWSNYLIQTEDAKERAIAAYSINVQEKKLLIFRIDVPRTTVIRITNIDDTAFSSKLVPGKITSICSSYGELYKQKLRGKAILDVYFKLAEWPNILSILNR